MVNNYFGPLDPYVLLPTAPLAGAAIVLLFNGVVLWGLLAVVLAGLLLAFDSWANRPERIPPPPRRRTPHHYTRY